MRRLFSRHLLLGAILASHVGISFVKGGDKEQSAEAARKVERGSVRPGERFVLQANILQNVDQITFSLEYGIVEVVGDRNDGSDAQVARRPVIRFQADTLDWAIFDGDREKGLRKLQAVLERELTLLDRVMTLNDEQRQKLRLAGRGDLHRLLHEIESLRPAFEQLYDQGEDGGRETLKELNQLMAGTALLRTQVDEGPVTADSFFEKTLRRMLPAEAYSKVVEARNEFRPPRKKRIIGRQGFLLDVF